MLVFPAWLKNGKLDPAGQGLLYVSSITWKGVYQMGFRDTRTGTLNNDMGDGAKSPMFEHNPELWDCLAGYEGDKGKRIPGCKMSVWIELGNVKLCVNDDHMGRVGFALLDTSLTLSQAIEQVLDGNGLEWRPRGKKQQ